MLEIFVMKEKPIRKQVYARHRHRRTPQKSGPARARDYPKPQIAPSLRPVLSRIGRPDAAPFIPDDFQLQALDAIRQNDCLVIAPTGSGKTWIAREAIVSVMAKGGRSWYASPLKALSNSKWVEFGLHFDP